MFGLQGRRNDLEKINTEELLKLLLSGLAHSTKKGSGSETRQAGQLMLAKVSILCCSFSVIADKKRMFRSDTGHKLGPLTIT